MAIGAESLDFFRASEAAIGGQRRTSQSSSKPGLITRLVWRVRAMRQAQLEDELAAYVERSGGRITDDIERRIGRRIMGTDWRLVD